MTGGETAAGAHYRVRMLLMPPHVRFQRSYLDAVDEFDGQHRDGDGEWGAHPDGRYPGVEFTRAELETAEGFQRFVDWRLADRLEDTPRPAAFVPCTYLWMVEGDEYVGSLSIRHRLTDFLLNYGGHIGYSVRPSRRLRGHAKAALAQAIPRAAELGIGRVLVTCDEDNDGSRRTIEANGGVYEDSREGKRRYWIETNA